MTQEIYSTLLNNGETVELTAEELSSYKLVKKLDGECYALTAEEAFSINSKSVNGLKVELSDADLAEIRASQESDSDILDNARELKIELRKSFLAKNDWQACRAFEQGLTLSESFLSSKQKAREEQDLILVSSLDELNNINDDYLNEY